MKKVLLMVSGLILLLVAVREGSLFGGELLKTGQVTSYTDYDDAWWVQQSDIGVSFSYQTANPAAAGDVVTIDNVTGLMWASDGSAEGCNFWAQTDWDSAIDWAQNLTFAGYSDWRLPDVRELFSLVVEDAGIGAPYINHAFFPNTVSFYYWSSTSNPLDTGYALCVHFNLGSVGYYDKTNYSYVRAVRGGE